MHTVKTRLLMTFDEVGSTGVRRQHALFDQAMRIIGLTGQNCRNLTVFIGLHIRFARCKVDGAAFLTGGSQYLVKRIKLINLGLHFTHGFNAFDFTRQSTPYLRVR